MQYNIIQTNQHQNAFDIVIVLLLLLGVDETKHSWILYQGLKVGTVVKNVFFC